MVTIALALGVVVANSDVKTWTLKNKERFSAELVSYDEGADQVHLKIKEKEDRYFKLNEFSAVDKAWIVEWLEFEELLTESLDSVGGNFEHFLTPGQYPTNLYVYYPSVAIH